MAQLIIIINKVDQLFEIIRQGKNSKRFARRGAGIENLVDSLINQE